MGEIHKDVVHRKPILNDSAEEMRDVVGAMLVEAPRILRQDCCCCCCCGGGGPKPTFSWVAQRLDEKPWSFFHAVVWDKNNPCMGWRYRRGYEFVMVAHLRSGKLAWNPDAVACPNVIRETTIINGRLHPNEKPLRLISRFIINHTIVSDVVLDPFMGSGSTGVAALSLGRKFIGIEMDEAYFDIACRRIEAESKKIRLPFDAATPKVKQCGLMDTAHREPIMP
jgi:hypothetical protein